MKKSKKSKSEKLPSVRESSPTSKKLILPSVLLIIIAVSTALIIFLCPKNTDINFMPTATSVTKSEVPESTPDETFSATPYQTQETLQPTPSVSPTPKESEVPESTPDETFNATPYQTQETLQPTPSVSPTPKESEIPDNNLFDGYFEKGTIGKDGKDVDSNDQMRSGYIKVSPNEMYTLSVAYPGYPCSYSNLVEYDADKKLVRYCAYPDTMDPRTFITSAKTEYIRFFTSKSEFSTFEYMKLMDYKLLLGRDDSLVQRFENGLTHDLPSSEGISNMLARLSVFCDTVLTTSGNGMTIGFTDKNKVGQTNPYSEYKLSENEKIIGFPYSSVRKTNTYIGIDVGVYTFFSAIKNPTSIIYTSDYRNPDDPGYSPWIFYAWCPYGAVCSSMIDHAFDLDFVYTTYEWETIDGMDKLDMSQNEIQLGDVLCNVTANDFSGGHMAIVTDILRNADNQIKYIQISEPAIPCMNRTYVTYDYFQDQYLRIYSVYRYAYPERIPEPDRSLIFDEISFNESLALNKGDMSVYKDGETAQISILDENAEYLVILCDGTECARIEVSEIKTKTINGKQYKIYEVKHTQTGKYSAHLEYKDAVMSEDIQWEHSSTGNSGISTTTVISGQDFELSFDGYSNCKPFGVCLETSTYVTRYQRKLTDSEISSGKVTLSYEHSGSYTVRIVYKTEFGRIYSERKTIIISE